MLINQFAISWSTERIKPHRVAILVDDSQSMGIEDGVINRADQVEETIRKLSFEKSNSDYEIRYYSFGSRFSEGKDFSFHQPESNYEEVFFKLFNRTGTKPDDVILISDGNINKGVMPTAIIKNGFVPVHCVAIGDSSFRSDISIPSILHPVKSYVNDAISLSTTIRGIGVSGFKPDIILSDENGREIDRKNLEFSRSDFNEQTIAFEITPDKSGKNSWSISVETEEGEENTNNNTRSFVIDVLERRKNILLFTPEPNADAAAVASSLEDLDDFDTKILVGAGKRGDLLRGSWADTSLHNDGIVIFLQGKWNSKSLKWLERITKEKHPIFFISGEKIEPGIRSILNQNSGTMRINNSSGESEITPGTSHAIFTEDKSWISGFDRSMPPLNLSQVLSLNGEMLAYAQDGAKKIPVLTILKENPRTLYFGVSGLWRWKIFSHSQIENRREFDSLIARVFRWLTTTAENERVFIKSSKDIYFGNEEVELIANVYDESQLGAENVVVSVEVEHDNQNYTYELNPIGGGRFLNQFSPWGSGKYKVNANIRNENEILTRSTEFYVDEFSVELSDTRMRPDVLREIAEVSGGGLYFPGEEYRLLEQLNPSEDLEVVSGTWRPFGLSLTLLIIIATLGIEWLFRIRRGMV